MHLLCLSLEPKSINLRKYTNKLQSLTIFTPDLGRIKVNSALHVNYLTSKYRVNFLSYESIVILEYTGLMLVKRV